MHARPTVSLVRGLWILAALSLLALTSGLSQPIGESADQDSSPLSVDHSVARITDREGLVSRRPLGETLWSAVPERSRLQPGDWLRVGTRGANALTFELRDGARAIAGPGSLIEVLGSDRLALHRGELSLDVEDRGPVTLVGAAGELFPVQKDSVFRTREKKTAKLDHKPAWLEGYEKDESTEAIGSLLSNVDGRNVALTLGYHKVEVDIRDQIARTRIEESFLNHTKATLEGVFYFPLPPQASVSSFAMWIGGEKVQADIVEKQRAREIYETILREKRDPGLLEWTGGNLFKARVYPIHREKRIEISYTETLAKNADTYSYHHALRSDKLKAHPISKLELRVTLASQVPLENVHSPTHACRIRSTDHVAQVEYSAQEVLLEEDFELQVRVAPQEQQATLVTHDRDGDGYFMLLLDAPELESRASEERTPLDLVVLADTSASMWGDPRKAQIGFLEALLSGLSPDDRVNVATCDTEVRWLSKESLQATDETREKALSFVESRDPLGWSDLRTAFGDVMKAVRSQTHVVYIGDGQVTAQGVTAAELCRLIEDRYKGRGSFHVVVPGNQEETSVAKALSSLGRGSLRRLSAGKDIAQEAFDLLHEVARPGLHGLRVSFSGWPVAAVYPQNLPNLPPGAQQVIVGRFDPSMPPKDASVRVTGFQGDKEYRVEFPIELDQTDQGNSHLPRLWARHHLDHLLLQGPTSPVRDRVIALSEDYQIITPYTSFLVLESDADRERFSVRKSFRMRDGEEFFLTAKNDATFALRHEQMNASKSYRQEIRRSILRELRNLGRPLTESLFEAPTRGTYAVGRSRGGGERSLTRQLGVAPRREAKVEAEWSSDEAPAGGLEEELDFEDEFTPDGGDTGDRDDFATGPRTPGPPRSSSVGKKSRAQVLQSRTGASKTAERLSSLGYIGQADDGFFGSNLPLANLFPHVPNPLGASYEPLWSDEAKDLLTNLDRSRLLREKGLRIVESYERKNERKGYARTVQSLSLLGPGGWLTTTPHAEGDSYSVEWLDAEHRGVYEATWRLGRQRALRAGDENSFSTSLPWSFGRNLHSFEHWDIQTRETEEGLTELTFTRVGKPEETFHLFIDRAKDVCVRSFWQSGSNKRSVTQYGDFLEVAGVWWPTRITTSSPDGEITLEKTLSIESFDSDSFAKAFREEHAKRLENAILLSEHPGELAVAKQAADRGEASVDQHLQLLAHYASQQLWDRGLPHIEALEARMPNSPGLTAIRLTWHGHGRSHQAGQAFAHDVAKTLAASPQPMDLARARSLLSLAHFLDRGEERQSLLTTLEPIYDRHHATHGSRFEWERSLLSTLQNMKFVDRAEQKIRDMVRDFPHQVETHLSFAQHLDSEGDLDLALRYLGAVEAEKGPWPVAEKQRLRGYRMDLLWNAHRLEELVETIEAWMREMPQELRQYDYDRYLSALFMIDRSPKALGLMETWLLEHDDEPLTEFERNRARAAIAHATGRGHALYHQALSDADASLLVKAFNQYVPHAHDHGLAKQILQSYQYRVSDAGREATQAFLTKLSAEIADRPIEDLVRWASSINHYREGSDKPWKSAFDSLFDRAAASSGNTRRILAFSMQYAPMETRQRWLRMEVDRTPSPRERRAAASSLAELLLHEGWSADDQTEMEGLFVHLGPLESDSVLESESAEKGALKTLYRFGTWMVDARVDAELASLENVNELTRREQARERARLRRDARIQAAKTLASLRSHDCLKPWITVDEIYWRIKSRNELEQSGERSAALLSNLTTTDRHGLEGRITHVLARRCVDTLTYLVLLGDESARSQRSAELTEILEARDAQRDQTLDWKARLYVLLVALDQGDRLEEMLTGWFGSGEDFTKIHWGRALAHIQAERSKLQEAIETLTRVESHDDLFPEDYRLLADWRTALGDRQGATVATSRSWEASTVHEIWTALQAELGASSRSAEHVPRSLGAQVPHMIEVLLRKSSSPNYHARQLKRLYQNEKDFRILEGLPSAMLGHTSQSLYELLKGLDQVLKLIGDEATVDRLEDAIELALDEAETDTDERALYLLRFVVNRRAADQAHGTALHVETALGALKEAVRLEWGEAEAFRYAQLLIAQAPLSQESLIEEMLRQLHILEALQLPGTIDDLQIAQLRSQALHTHGRAEEALTVLEASLDALREATDGLLPPAADSAVAQHVDFLCMAGRFMDAESLARREEQSAPNDARKHIARTLLSNTYFRALEEKAPTRLGSGRDLYRELQKLHVEEIQTTEHPLRARNLVPRITRGWNLAKQRGWKLEDEARRFAFSVLPDILRKHHYNNGQSMVGTVAQGLRDNLGYLTELEFLANRAENEPPWLRRKRQNFWAKHSSRVCYARAQLSSIAEPLQSRLVDIYVEALRARLHHGRDSRVAGCSVRRPYFWREKKDVFLQATLSYLQEEPRPEKTVHRAAQYLFLDLEARSEGIAVLDERHRAQPLSLSSMATLADYLRRESRFEEALPYWDHLIAAEPDKMLHRGHAMRCLHGHGDVAKAREYARAAQVHFRASKAWKEGNIAVLAEASVDSHLDEEAADLFSEAIALRTKTAPNRGIGDGKLCRYYRSKALAHSRLGQTARAVDAASGAILSWGKKQKERQQELERLIEVLAHAEDLEAFMKKFEQETEVNGLENPILRKALGRVLDDRGQHREAALQLEKAIAVRPADIEAHGWLVAAFDSQGDSQRATHQLLASARLSGHDPSLYEELGDRFQKLEDEARAERAFTTLVEVLAEESEGHQALARIREDQKRWKDAVIHWSEVTRLHSDEPDGYLNLASALIEAGNTPRAKIVLNDVLAKTWPSRFGDISKRARDILKEL